MIKRVIFLFFMIHAGVWAQDKYWQTFYEKSGYKETSRHQETVDFCTRLDEASPAVTFTSFGKSARGKDLPLMIIDSKGYTDPQVIHASGKLILLIQACIHPGECEGKDAGIMLIRDIVILNRYPHLLDHVSILFIPVFNVDGDERFGPYNRINQNGPKEMGWRVTASNLNLNRDFLKADTPEIQAWLKMFNTWKPDFFIDSHTTDGADYQYVLTYQMEISGEMDAGLTQWSDRVFLHELTARMERSGYLVFPYVEFRNWHDPGSGLKNNVSPPMLSQGYAALRNCPGLLIETHMLKPYEQRVASTYECFRIALEILNKEHRELGILISRADAYSSSTEFREHDFPLTFETIPGDSILVDFKGFRYNTVKSAVTGDLYIRYTKEKFTYQIPFFEKMRPVITTRLPEAYIVPVEWKNVIDRMQFHGIRMIILDRDTTLNVSLCKLKKPKWQAAPYEGRHPLVNIEYDEFVTEKKFPAGSALIDMNQPASRIIAHILEPNGKGSFLYWGFFDAIFEQKEYAEKYVMEELAARMLENDPGLRSEFEARKAQDPGFGSNPGLVLNWFFSKTPYWDSLKDIYPIGKILDREILESLGK